MTLISDRMTVARERGHCAWCPEMIEQGEVYAVATLEDGEDGPCFRRYHRECFSVADWNAELYEHQRGSKKLLGE